MSLTPIHHLLHPASAHLQAWEEAEVPVALAFVLDHLWFHRVVGWVGYPDESVVTLDQLWSDLAEVHTADELLVWTARFRTLLWGSDRHWSQEIERSRDLQEINLREMQWARAHFLVGPALLDWIAEDRWQVYAQRCEERNWDYGDLRHLQNRRFQDRLTSHPVHPEPEGGYSLRQIRRLAQHLADRFGLRSIATAGGMPLSDVWSAFREAEVGLGAMAQALRWAEHDLGAQRLGLAFELSPPRGRSGWSVGGGYESRLGVVHVGRQGGWGSFAHEWGHALDEAVGLGWYPKAEGLKRFASVRAEDPHTVLMRANDELIAFRTRDVPILSHVQSFHALRSAIEKFPDQLNAFRDRLPYAEWDERLNRRLAALAPWTQAVLQGRGSPRQWRAQWKRWRRDNDMAFSEPESAHAQAWKAHWDRTVEVAEQVFFGPWPGRPSWRVWAAARDRIEALDYWDTPHEAFARMIHALVRQGVGSDTWVAETPLQGDSFPQGADLAAARAWWLAQHDLLHRHWLTPTAHLRLAWAGARVILHT